MLAPAVALAQREFSVVIHKDIAGHLKIDDGPSGEVRTDLSYRDNGRGPDIREVFTLDATGAPNHYSAEGKSTFGAEIRETFTVDGTRLRWQSRVDRGDQALASGTLFVPLEGTVAYTGELVRALLRRDGGTAPVLAGNKLAAEQVGKLVVDGPGGRVPLALIALTGVDAFPWYFWHRDDSSKAFFAVAWPGFAIVPKGYEASVDALVQAGLRAEDERLVALQKRLARPLSGLTVVRSVMWFDAPAAVMRGPSDIFVRAGRIAAIADAGALDVQADNVIDGRGRTLLPGLFDMHVHIWAGAGPMHLAAGVTSVRDLGGENTEVLRLQTRFASGELPGPTMYAAGFIEGKSPYSSRNGFVVDSVEDGKRAIDWYAARGYRQIKLYNSIEPDWVQPLAAHAKARGLTVAGHVPAFMKAEQAVRAGYNELTHINQVMLNFIAQPGDDTRTLLRFTRVGDDAGRVVMAGPEVRAFVALLRERGIVVDPTAGAFESMLTQQQGQPDPGLQPVAEYLPVLWRRRLRVAEMDLDGQKLTTYRASYKRLLDLIRVMHQAGVPLVAGTDGTAGLGLHRELELYVEAGIPAPEVLQIATWNGARVAGASTTAGSIERGKTADLVLIDGDPSRRISDIRRTVLVLKGGVAYSPAELYEAMGFKPLVGGATIGSGAAPH